MYVYGGEELTLSSAVAQTSDFPNVTVDTCAQFKGPMMLMAEEENALQTLST